MTLTITAVTERCVYQCADYRLLDARTGEVRDFEAQKIALASTFSWSAMVCFAGVGRTHDVDVSEWLADRVRSIQQRDPFDRLVEELLTADAWLSTVPIALRRHSFAIGGFVGTRPVFRLVSNFETPHGPASDMAAPHLSEHRIPPSSPIVFVSGQKQAVTRAERRRLAALIARDPDSQSVYSALVELNKAAAQRSPLVSPACFTAHTRLTGEGGGQPHGLGERPFLPRSVLPFGIDDAVRKLLDEQFGPGRARLTGISSMRAEASDEFHELQLREKPNDPSVHCNYGVYLLEKKGDVAAAERHYRTALELDPRHVNALDLANLLWEKGEPDAARQLYEKALELDPRNANITWNFSRLLFNELGNRGEAAALMDVALKAHPDSGRLHLWRSQMHLLDGDPAAAVESARQARKYRADQASTETAFAIALQLSGAPVGDCIAAYEVALAIEKGNAGLHLNLAQLLFLRGESDRATHELREAQRLGLDAVAELEALFYKLAHTAADTASVGRRIGDLLARGGRLMWDVQANVDVAAKTRPQTATLLGEIARIMKGEVDQSALDRLVRQLAERR